MQILLIILICISMNPADAFESNHSSALKKKMLNGGPVNDGRKRFLAALVHNFQQYGTGFFITANILLTAASRLEKFFMYDNVDFNEFYAYVRSHLLYKNGIQYYFEHVEVHKNYDFTTKLPYYDIGAIKLIIPSLDIVHIRHLDLPYEDAVHKLSGQVSGWGPWTDSYETCQGEFVSPLLTMTFQVVSPNGKPCRAVKRNKFIMNPSIFCAANSSIDIAFPIEQKDIGTPFAWSAVKAFGLLSYFPEYDPEEEVLRQAAVFTSVFHYSCNNWIDTATKNLSARTNLGNSRIRRTNVQHNDFDLNRE